MLVQHVKATTTHVNKISPPEELGDQCSQLTKPNVLI